jgi:hypothetical protein
VIHANIIQLVKNAANKTQISLHAIHVLILKIQLAINAMYSPDRENVVILILNIHHVIYVLQIQEA